MESTQVVDTLLTDVVDDVFGEISWIQAGKHVGQFAIHKACLLMNNATDCIYQHYDSVHDQSVEDQEPAPGVLDPWGQPKLKLVARVIQNASPSYSHKSPSPDQMSVISESRRKSMALHRRITGKKNSSLIKLTSSKHGSEVSRLEVEEEVTVRGNGNKTKTRDQISLDLKRNQEGFSQDFTMELQQEMREKMARIQAYRKKTELEKQEAERRKKFGGIGNTMKPQIARVLTNDLKRLNSEMTQEAFYRETGNSQMKINNTTGYKFTFDAQGNVLLTRKNPLTSKKQIEPEGNLEFEVKQVAQAATLEKANLEALGGQEGLTTYDLDTSDRHSNRLKTLTLKSNAHSVKKTSVQGDKRKKHMQGDLYSEEIPILSELTDVQPAPSKALHLNSGVSLIEDGKKPILGPQLQRDRMTLDEYQQLQALQQTDIKLRFKNLEFFKRQQSRQKKLRSLAQDNTLDLKVTTKTRFKQIHASGLRDVDSTPVNRPIASRSAVGASFLDQSGIDQSITTHDMTAQELYCKMVDKGVLFKSREQKMDEKVMAYETHSSARNLSYNPRRAAQLKHKPIAIVEEARKALLELENPYKQDKIGLATSYSSNEILSPPSRVIAYSQQERNKKAPKRVPISTFDKFNQSLIRGETPQVGGGHNKSQADDPSPIPTLPKVHRDVSAKEFYYGPAAKDPLKQAKSMFTLGVNDSIDKPRKSTTKMPRERNLAHAALASEQKLSLLQTKIKEKKGASSPRAKPEKSARKKVMEKSLREMLRDDSITQIV